MTVYDLKEKIEATLAPAQPLSWDNDGLLVSGDPSRPVRRALLTLDVTAAAVEAALRGGYDTVLSHHPLIFSPLRSVTPGDLGGRRVVSLLSGCVSVLSYHTRLDAAQGGVNDALAECLGLSEVTPLGEGEAALGRIGTVPAMSPKAFALLAKERLGAPGVLLADGGREVKRVALVGGEGDDFLSAAKEAGADLFLSGRLGYHPMTDGVGEGMSLLECGHYYTEAPVLATLRAWLLSWDPTLQVEIFTSNALTLL